MSSAVALPLTHWGRMRSILSLVGCLLGLGLCGVASAAAECPNEQLRAENKSLQLPDCRAYEIVSPAGKTGGIGDVLAREALGQELRPMQATADGEAITYNGEAFLESPAGTINQYVSSRTPSGWDTTDVSLPEQEGVRPALVLGASADLSSFLFASEFGSQLSPEAPVGYSNLYVTKGTDVPVPVMTSRPANRTPETFGQVNGGSLDALRIAAWSDDLSEVYFAANGVLTENAPPGSETEDNLYRWAAGRLHLVNELPDGEREADASFGVTTTEPGDRGLVIPDLDHAVSASGLRAFWTDEHSHNLYLRETYFEAGEESERTVLVGEDAEFLAANGEGTVVFYKKEGDLYEYEVPTRTLLDLTPTPAAGVDGVVGVSEEGDYVYFVADGVLAEDAAPGDCASEAGERGRCSLYLYHDGAIKFIATLSGQDDQPGERGNGINPTPAGSEYVADWPVESWARSAEVSPDGRFLAFGSHLPLTGHLNAGPEIFVYDASTESLSCASCSPDGESNAGANLPSFEDSYGIYEPRYMLNDGRLFFTTAAALVPQDVNKQEDVYEWENGQVYLISAGTGSRPSIFGDASENGEDVFFTTSQALAPEDQDEITDMYDARTDGGFPSPSVAQCASSGECEGSPPSPPVFGPLGSATLSGVGDAVPPLATVLAPPKGTPKLLTRAEKLAKALRACRKDRAKSRRTSCEKQARARYGAKVRRAARKTGKKR
jgi:hypothetical protein